MLWGEAKLVDGGDFKADFMPFPERMVHPERMAAVIAPGCSGFWEKILSRSSALDQTGGIGYALLF
jgi:hypothetical protein